MGGFFLCDAHIGAKIFALISATVQKHSSAQSIRGSFLYTENTWNKSRKNYSPCNRSTGRVLTRPVFIYERVNDMSEKNNAQRCKFNEDVSGLSLEELGSFLEENAGKMITEERPFAAYMRRKLREKGLLQQNVFLAADLSEGFGYKLISEEKRTRQRDLILRLCLTAEFGPEEAQEALLRYGMAPMWWRFPRDAVLLAAFGSRVNDLQKVNELLEQYGQPPLLKGYE